ncbi:MAG TPA: class I SAM-dependent methyltransferase [Solirubrobacteraceae bacterium]
MSAYGDLVARGGLSAAHTLLLAAVPDRSVVLDVGCAEGYLAAALARRGCEVHGVESDAVAAEAARAHCATVWTIDVEDATAREGVGRGFDAVVLGDVLEHLRDPWSVLAWAAARLRDGGIAVVSVPNAVHWTVRREIARGRFPMRDWGTFDRTHLRWFTRSGARELLRGAGLTIEREQFTPAPLPGEALARDPDAAPGRALARARRLAADRAPELFALQFVLTGVYVP